MTSEEERKCQCGRKLVYGEHLEKYVGGLDACGNYINDAWYCQVCDY